MSDSREEGNPAAAPPRGRRSKGTPSGHDPDEDPGSEQEVAEGEEQAEGPEGEGDGEEVSEVDRLRRELDELNDRHLRLAAEFDNFRRRSHSQLGESGVRAQAALAAKLLDVLDDFERVTSVDPSGATPQSIMEGVELVKRKLDRVLEDAGLEAIEPVDEPFDPNSMEAMLREPTDAEEEDETVGRVLQRGFLFRGQLIRPARVSVRKHEA